MNAKPVHRGAVRALLALGTVLTVLAIFSVWAERQLLDTNEWVNTSSKVLDNSDVQTALSQYLINELYANVDVEAQLAKRLPPQAQTLAGPAAAGLREIAGDVALKAIQSSAFADGWAQANRAAHQVFLNLVEGNGNLVTAQGGAVTLQLEPLVADLATRLGISADVASHLPPDVASLQIIQANDLSLAQDIVNLIRKLAIVLSLLALGSFAFAIYLARDRRHVTVLWAGLGLITAGLIVYVLRHAAGNIVVDGLVKNDSARPAAEATWSIATSLMTSIANTVIVYGVLFVIASWLASPTSSARAARRALAPSLKDHPVAAYSLLVLAGLIYFALAPTHGLRSLLTVAFLVGLAAFGLAALRRQTAQEFPDARPGDTLARMREWGTGLRERRTARHAPAAETGDDRIARLERLAKLHEQGVLSDEEFAGEKAKVLGGAGPA